MKLLSFGEIVWDIYEDEQCLGGAPLNFASYAALFGEKVWLMSAVGNDKLGEKAIELIKNWGINTEYISIISAKETGKCIVKLNDNSVPTYNVLQDVAYDYMQIPQMKEEFDIIAFGTMALRSDNNKQILSQIIKSQNFSEIFVDVNIRPPFYSNDTILFCLRNASILKISEEEMHYIAEAISQKYNSAENFALHLCKMFKQIKLIIITKGENGAICYNRDEKKCYSCAASGALAW